ncbi:type III secretion system chaperone [Serratia marcescens]|uniref:type III secretion system chaperone n=1 Tax=Serratia marcescens TaxID=615 RepID=UPI000D7340DD|nr:type III secretion system chaperone [Serratia marcescens]AWO77484.1 hypothetical protein C1N78_02045 [Serratia marcescens]
MIMQDLLSALEKRLETGALFLDVNRLCCLQVDSLEMTLEFLEQQNSLFVYLNIGTLSSHGSALFLDLLAANLFHYGTCEGAAFGFDKEKNDVLLYQRFSLTLVNEDVFVGACVQMIEVAKVWQKKLSHSQPVIPMATHSLSGLNIAGKIK